MIIYNKKDGLYIQAWALYDPEKRYNEDYDLRPSDYFDDRVIKARKNLVISNCDINKAFDYGCGKMPFHYNRETKSSICNGMWDKYVPEFQNFDRKVFENSTTLLLFDVIEHFYDPHSFLLTVPQKRIIMTLPIVQEPLFNLEQISSWKHFKPGEHLLYTTEKGIVNIIEDCGWILEYFGYDECPPRKDIASIVIRRK